jgi:hypothetical protein
MIARLHAIHASRPVVGFPGGKQISYHLLWIHCCGSIAVLMLSSLAFVWPIDGDGEVR